MSSFYKKWRVKTIAKQERYKCQTKKPECIRQSEVIATRVFEELMLQTLDYIVEVKVEEKESESDETYVVILHSHLHPVFPYLEFIYYPQQEQFFLDWGINIICFEHYASLDGNRYCANLNFDEMLDCHKVSEIALDTIGQLLFRKEEKNEESKASGELFGGYDNGPGKKARFSCIFFLQYPIFEYTKSAWTRKCPNFGRLDSGNFKFLYKNFYY